jgi:hypothetical protein
MAVEREHQNVGSKTPSTYRDAVVHRSRDPLTIAQAPTPELAAGQLLELHAAGRTRLIREVRPLDTVNESMADVEAGRVAARVVFGP